MWVMKENYGWLIPHEEVQKYEGSIMLKMHFVTSKEGAVQAADNPTISTYSKKLLEACPQLRGSLDTFLS